jgi:tetratricopeptide (TPR) repeat protein
MLSTLLLASSAATLLAASNPSRSCGMSGPGSGLAMGGLAIAGVLGAVTSPIWGPVYLVGKGIGMAIDAIDQTAHPSEAGSALTVKDVDWKKRNETVELKKFFAEAEKNPTPTNLFAAGLQFFVAEDFAAADNYFRRASELVKKNPNYLQDKTLLSVLALSENQRGNLKMQQQRFNNAVEHFQEAYDIITKHLEGSKASNDDDEKKAAHNNNETSSNILSADSVGDSLAYAKLHAAVYSDSCWAWGSDEVKAAVLVSRTNNLNEAVSFFTERADRLQSAPETVAKYETLLKAAIAVFYKYAEEVSYRWKNPEALFYTKTVAEIKALFPTWQQTFRENVLPRFEKVLSFLEKLPNKKNASHSGELLGWCGYYLSRIYFLLGDDKKAKSILAKCGLLLPADELERQEFPESCPIALEKLEKGVEQDEPGYYTNYENLAREALRPHALPPQAESSEQLGHDWKQHFFKVPTFCSVCSEFINLEENSEAFRCEYCYKGAHKHCREKIGDSAPCAKRSQPKEGATNQHQHVLTKTNLHKPTFCSSCSKFIVNPFGAYKCSLCFIVVDKSCAQEMKNAVISD